MNKEKMAEISFQIILHAGNAYSSALEAVRQAREEHFDEVDALMEEARVSQKMAHDAQTSLMTESAQGGESMIPDILMVHAQCHLNNCVIMLELAEELICLHRKINKKDLYV